MCSGTCAHSWGNEVKSEVPTSLLLDPQMQKGFFHPPPPLPTDDTWRFCPGNRDELKSSLHVLSVPFPLTSHLVLGVRELVLCHYTCGFKFSNSKAKDFDVLNLWFLCN